MAYVNFQNCTAQQYKDIIYSEGNINKIKIYFNDVELEDADIYCEKLTRKVTVNSNDGNKVFNLSNFMSQELELILHDINISIIQDQVKILIGTLVDETNETYEYVPIGIFNIENSPTTDKNKTVIKLRDNRVKFDFNYNAKPLIDSLGGSATYMQILQDICTQARVENGVLSFLGQEISIGFYDNTIKATNYVAYIAEQAGCFPATDRTGKLIFVPLNALTTIKIPLSLIEKYDKGTPYNIQRVVYESGVIKYQTSDSESLSTLFLNSANPYIFSQSQVDGIYNIVQDFEIDSVVTGRVLGNPAIDPYDIIEVYGYYEDDEYGNHVFVDDENTIVFKILASYTETYNGRITHEYNNEISLEKRTENISLKSGATYKKIIKSEFDAINGRFIIVGERIDNQDAKILNVEVSVDELNSKIQDISDITTAGETSYATLDLDNVNESEPITVKIRPINENISYDYPHNDYPQNDYSKIRILRFTNRTDNTCYDYEIPVDLLYYDNTTYDEFRLSYDSHACQVTKKCKYNADGSVGLLTTPQTLTFDYPEIILTDGDYTIQLLGYTSAYLSVRLMAKNAYTTQFYTKVETNSIINQTEANINTNINQKFTNYSTTAEMNSAIEQKANQVTSSVSSTYTTKTESTTNINIAKNEAIASANSSTDNKLTNYSTTLQMNTAINDKADEIESGVAETYSTKTETTTAKNEAINTSNSATDSKLQNYSNTSQMNNAIDTAKTSAINTADSHTDSKLASYSTTTQMTNVIDQKIGENENNIKAFVEDTYTTIETYETGIGNANNDINTLSNGLTDTNNQLENTNNKFNNYATNQSVTTIRNNVTSLQTSLNAQIEITEDIQQNGVSKVKTTTDYTFDANGLDIKKSDEPTESIINNNGVVVKDDDEILLFAGYDTSSNTSKVETHDMSIRDHEILMGHIRVEEYSGGVGWFWLG